MINSKEEFIAKERELNLLMEKVSQAGNLTKDNLKKISLLSKEVKLNRRRFSNDK